MKFFNDLFNLIYPNICLACDGYLSEEEACICSACRYNLPQTNYHFEKNNPILRVFWGRMSINNACSYYFYKKGGKVQKLLHRLKYEGHKTIGLTIGEQYGYQLLQSPLYQDIDLIVPVPLHPAKKVKRGYNQSDLFAEGLSTGMKIGFSTDLVKRVQKSDTQTNKSRYNRWENVKSIFSIGNPGLYTGKHFLLVDDVITTGSTLEACAASLLEIKGAKVSIATIACA